MSLCREGAWEAFLMLRSWWIFWKKKRCRKIFKFRICGQRNQFFSPAARSCCHSSSWGETILWFHDHCHRQEQQTCQVIIAFLHKSSNSHSVLFPLLFCQSTRVRWRPPTPFQEGENLSTKLLLEMAVSREGVENPSCGWIAMDMGNIALHLLDQVLDDHFEPVCFLSAPPWALYVIIDESTFIVLCKRTNLQERRELYDLESLWTVGPEFDDATRFVDILTKWTLNWKSP